jgi:[protein-PII] uridylyltransferase
VTERRSRSAAPEAGASAGRVPVAELRAARDAAIADVTLRGATFGERIAQLLDRLLTTALATVDPTVPVAVVALGSYGRRELCPGSDVDALLLHDLPRRRAAAVRDIAEALWYPLWDSGFVTGHGARTPKESLDLAAGDLDVLTALLQARFVAGDRSLADRLVDGAHRLAERRRDRLVRQLAQAAELRRVRPGPVAEMLEPDLKDGAGGLRDIQSLAWAGWTLGPPGGLAALEARGYLDPDDRHRLRVAGAQLLDVRVALHRLTGGRHDLLALQEQDAVAAALGAPDADELVRRLAAGAREVAWITRDVFDRLCAGLRPPSRTVATRERTVVPGVAVRDGRVVVSDTAPATLTVLEAAITAAELELPFERASLARLAEMAEPVWDVWERAALLRLLRAGSGAVPVFEALDHAGVLVRLVPEWSHVRSLPQRNAYHRFTVDRHLLEAVAECARLLDAGDAVTDPGDASIEAVVARACRRPELLLLGALLHDVGKGRDGDHSATGSAVAEAFARRIGLDSEGREILAWLVRDHLVMADIATRRDLSEAAVVERFADRCAGDPERLRLLYLLTVGDSKATGPAAWSRTKEALLRDLFVKAAAVIEQRGAGDLAAQRRAALGELVGAERAAAHFGRLPASYLMAFDATDMVLHERLLRARALGVECAAGDDDRPVVTVVAPDRAGLLATLAGALTIAGLSVREAFLFSTADGWALDVFRATDPYGRFADGGPERVREVLRRALLGELDVDRHVRERAAAYRRRRAPGPVHVRVDLDASDRATVIEVDADDDVGVLYRVADTFARRGLDVSIAKVHTLGERIVDVFYVRHADGRRVDDPIELARLRDVLVARLGPGGWDHAGT